MAVCEKCWNDAFDRYYNDPSKPQSEHYRDLLEERKNNRSTPKENSAHSFTEGMDVPESEPSSKHAPSEASEQKESDNSTRNDALGMRINVPSLEEFLPTDDFELEPEVSPVVPVESSVVTQSEKGETAEEVLDNVALKHGHKDWELARCRLGENHLHVLILEAMQEHSLLERSRAREEAIQDCIDMANKAEMRGNTIGILVHQLYGLKNK